MDLVAKAWVVIGVCIHLVSTSWSMSLQDSVTWLENNGFPFAKIISDSSGHSQLLRGSAWVWGSLQRLDSGQTSRELLERISGIRPGEPVRLSQLQIALERIRLRPWLADAEPLVLYRKARRNILIPALRTQECPSSSLEGWVYWSNQFQGNLDFRLVNFLGTGRSYSLGLLQKDSLRSLIGRAEEPFVFHTDWSLILEGAWKQEGLASEWMQWMGEGQFDYGVWKLGVGGQWNGILQQREWVVQELLIGSALRKSAYWESRWHGGLGQRKGADSSHWVAEHQWNLHRTFPWTSTWALVMDGYSRGLWPLNVMRAPSEMLDLGYTEFWGIWPGNRTALQVQGARSGIEWKTRQWNVRLLAESGLYRNYDAQWHVVHQYGFVLGSHRGSTQIHLRLFWELGSSFGEGVLAVGLRNEW